MNNFANKSWDLNSNTNLKNLLEKAHSQDFEVIDTVLEQMPSKEYPIAVVKKVIKVNGRIYSAIGEASTQNVDELVKESLISMADTRALCRALRVATNTPETSYEELKHNNSDSKNSNDKKEEKWTKKQEKAYDYYLKKKEITGELQVKINELQDKRKKQGYLSLDEVKLIIGQLKSCPDKETNDKKF